MADNDVNLPNITADFANEVAVFMADLAGDASEGNLTELEFTSRLVAFLRRLDEWIEFRYN